MINAYCLRVATIKSMVRLCRAIHMGRIVPDIEPDLDEKLQDNSVNPKLLRTRQNYGFTPLPARLHAVAEERLQRYSDRAFRQEVKYLLSVIYNLKLPDDKDTLKIKKANIKAELEIRDKFERYNPEEFKLQEDEQINRDKLSDMIQGILTERKRDWHYFEYDERASLMYMATRLAPNYASIKTVMREIRSLDPEFKPKSVLDFGSGMGTSNWAVNEIWPNEVEEFMNVELSQEQQYLCEYLLREGKDYGNPLHNVFHKQYLPTSSRNKYDMVIAAFSMLELPNREIRAQTIENLWHKTNDLLVIIERGNRGGFATVNEARHFVLDLSGHDVTKKLNLTTQTRPVPRLRQIESHVMAPCSHEFVCPRSLMSTKKNMDVCRFKVAFEPLEIGEKRAGIQTEQFSYVVLRKRPHPNLTVHNCPSRWPRIVEARKRAGGQVTHKLCCPNGNLAETIITKAKYGKSCYRLAKACDWGDILPIKVKDTYEVKNSKLIKSS